MKNFSDYAKNKKQAASGAGNKADTQGFNFTSGEIPSGAFETLNDLASKYRGADESELLCAVLSEAKRSRKNGTLSDEQIDEFVSAISPMLGEEQRKKLFAVAEKIKRT